VFDYKGKDLVAMTTADGSLHLIDSAKPDAPLAKTSIASGAGFATGALASWQDPAGNRWLLAPSSGAVVAYKVVAQGGTPALQAAWTSREMIAPLPPMVINGVIFALSSGEFRSSDAKLSAADRAKKSSPAVLYALEASTGKELWNSGKTIASFAHSGGLAGGGSRIYVGTYDGWQYAFGVPIEH
jgi:outer membrane protein assembly factor BamB